MSPFTHTDLNQLKLTIQSCLTKFIMEGKRNPTIHPNAYVTVQRSPQARPVAERLFRDRSRALHQVRKGHLAADCGPIVPRRSYRVGAAAADRRPAG